MLARGLDPDICLPYDVGLLRRSKQQSWVHACIVHRTAAKMKHMDT